MQRRGYPPAQGLYDPGFEHDACGFGFVVDLKARASNDIVRKALRVLVNLEHRGATGYEKNTGDGAGILTQLPHAYLAQRCRGLGIQLPPPGDYGVGMLFLPVDAESRQACERKFEEAAAGEGQSVLGWRDVPTDNGTLGASARAAQPVIRQVFVARGAGTEAGAAFDRKLYVVRRLVEKSVSRSALPGRDAFYV